MFGHDIEESKVSYHALESKQLSNPVEAKNASPLLRVATTSSSVVVNRLLPFLNSQERASFTSSSRSLQHIDEKIDQIRLLHQWENFIELEAKSVDWKKLFKTKRALFAMLTGFAAAGSTIAFQYLIRASVEYNSITSGYDDDSYVVGWRTGGPILATLFALGTLLCTGGSVRAIRLPYKHPRDYKVSKDDRLVSHASQESKELVDQFNSLFPESQCDVDNSNLRLVFQKVRCKKAQLRLFIDSPEAAAQHAIDVKDQATDSCKVEDSCKMSPKGSC